MTVFLGIVFGSYLGISAAIFIVGTLLEKSNNKGDTTGSFRSFSDKPLGIYERRDHLSKPPQEEYDE